MLFNLTCNAFSSYVKIDQINGRGGNSTRTILAAKINSVMGKDPSGKMSYKLLDRVLSATAISLLATKGNNVEDRRIIWTTYTNLKMWFENWTANLLELGFAKDEEDPYIPEDQLSCIGNIDETCISLDGSKGNRGGRP